jgi:hypothetical protein
MVPQNGQDFRPGEGRAGHVTASHEVYDGTAATLSGLALTGVSGTAQPAPTVTAANPESKNVGTYWAGARAGPALGGPRGQLRAAEHRRRTAACVQRRGPGRGVRRHRPVG